VSNKGPSLARDRSGRRYVWPPNTDTPEMVVPSVTTILNKMGKPALPYWAAKSVAEFAHDYSDQWIELPRDAAVDMLKRAPWRDRDNRANIGTAVHNAIEAHITGETAMVEPDNLPFISGALQFLEEHVRKLVHVEATIFNRRYQYAGTCDIVAVLNDGRTAVVDWKTSRSGLWPEVALQLQAYAGPPRHLDEPRCFVAFDDGTTTDLVDIDVGVAVWLPGDATYEAREIELNERLWKTFLACRTLQKWKDDHENDALGRRSKGGDKAEDNDAA